MGTFPYFVIPTRERSETGGINSPPSQRRIRQRRNTGIGSSIVPPPTETKRDPRYMRVSKLLTLNISAYGSSVTAMPLVPDDATPAWGKLLVKPPEVVLAP